MPVPSSFEEAIIRKRIWKAKRGNILKPVLRRKNMLRFKKKREVRFKQVTLVNVKNPKSATKFMSLT